VGDFNLAPREQDGLYGAKVSSWTKATERKALHRLLDTVRLVDLFVAHDGEDEERFTYEKLNRGKMTRFRCDLALLAAPLAAEPTTAIRHCHETRLGDASFTDHSSVPAELRDDVAACAEHVEIFPASTAIARSDMSSPIKELAERAHVAADHRVLDFGCGRGADVRGLTDLGVDAVGYDPHEAFEQTHLPAATSTGCWPPMW
jgi:hypothetical protein